MDTAILGRQVLRSDFAWRRKTAVHAHHKHDVLYYPAGIPTANTQHPRLLRACCPFEAFSNFQNVTITITITIIITIRLDQYSQIIRKEERARHEINLKSIPFMAISRIGYASLLTSVFALQW